MNTNFPVKKKHVTHHRALVLLSLSRCLLKTELCFYALGGMKVMGITSLGIGAGLDTASMLQKMKESEQTRLNPYTNKQKSCKGKISAWGKISSLLSSLRKSVTSLSDDAFNTLTVSSNKAFTAKAGKGAQADVHDITVEQLAQAHKLRTKAQNSADSALGTPLGGKRTVTITQKDGSITKVELEDDETSLNQIAKAINKQKGDVSASVQRTDNGYQLVLSSKKTGTDGEISVKVNGDTALGAILDTSSGGQHIDDAGNIVAGDPGRNDNMVAVADAKNAKLRVDGSEYTRSSNNITDILDGITLKLDKVSEKDDKGNFKSEELTLTADTSAIKTNLKEFVKQYNALLSATTDASKYVKNESSNSSSETVATPNSKNGALMGDSMLRGLVSEVRSSVNGVYGDADYSSLADLGIKIDSATGQMTLDESKLDKAIADKPEQIANMFTGRDDRDGLAKVMGAIITYYIGDDKDNKGGIIKTATDNLDYQLKNIQLQIDKTQKLIDAQVERYRLQFQNLDKAMSKLNSAGSQLTALLSSL